MANVNRMLVTEWESHTTEERRIEDRRVDILNNIKREHASQTELIEQCEWQLVIATARAIEKQCQQMYLLETRLQDVRQINATFARINEHIERIEATEEVET